MSKYFQIKKIKNSDGTSIGLVEKKDWKIPAKGIKDPECNVCDFKVFTYTKINNTIICKSCLDEMSRLIDLAIQGKIDSKDE